MKHSRIAVLGIIISIILLSACSKKSDTETTAVSNEDLSKVKIDTSKLDDGGYYIRHQNGEIEPLYFGAATFEQGNTVGNPDNDRVIWFKDDFNNIPTLYAGDILFYFSTDELSETFEFERFENYGYSVGLCKLKPSPSGRCLISTKTSDNCTFPNSDTDELLTVKNDNIIIDSIGGMALRYEENAKGEYTSKHLTRSGSIFGLKQDSTYIVQIYSGTEKMSTINLKADVDIMGSMETFTTHEFDYLGSDDVISITIPKWLVSGYYMIDGEGVFKYIKGTKTDEANGIDLKTPNQEPSDNYNFRSILTQTSYNASEAKSASLKPAKFKVVKEGPLTVKVTLSVPLDQQNFEGDYIDASMQIMDPDGNTYPFVMQDENNFEYTFDNAKAGEYQITFYDLGNRIPKVEVY